MKDHLAPLYPKLIKEDNFLFRELVKEVFKRQDTGHTPGWDDNKEKHYITLDAYFKLGEYVELTEARRASKRATWFASAALVLSLIALMSDLLIKYFTFNCIT